jgi:hypothetical protein
VTEDICTNAERGSMIAAVVALALAGSTPATSVYETRSFRCGWSQFSIDAVEGDRKSKATIKNGVLTVTFSGADVQRTVFLIVDGAEERIRGRGPLSVERAVPKHRMHTIILGTTYYGELVYAEAFCLNS